MVDATITHQKRRIFTKAAIIEDLGMNVSTCSVFHQFEANQQELRAIGSVVGCLQTMGDPRGEIPQITRTLRRERENEEGR